MTGQFDVWTEWNQNASSWEHFMAGDYLLDFKVPLKSFNVEAVAQEKGQDGSYCLGDAHIQIIDEVWIENRKGESLIDRVHSDFNFDLNWNEYTPYEFLEDGLKCVSYGQPGGITGTIALLHQIQIHPPYRGLGLFREYLMRIISQLKKMKVDYLALQPHPFGGERLETEEIELDIMRLRRFYSTFGFIEVPIDNGVPYMIVPLNSGIYSKVM